VCVCVCVCVCVLNVENVSPNLMVHLATNHWVCAGHGDSSIQVRYQDGPEHLPRSTYVHFSVNRNIHPACCDSCWDSCSVLLVCVLGNVPRLSLVKHKSILLVDCTTVCGVTCSPVHINRPVQVYWMASVWCQPCMFDILNLHSYSSVQPQCRQSLNHKLASQKL